MSGCGCRICRSGNAEVVNDLVLVDGFSLSEVHQWVTDELSLDFTERGLKKHFDAFEIPIVSNIKTKSKSSKDYSSDNSSDLPTVSFNPQSELEKLDLSDFTPDPSNPQYLIGKLQTLHLDIHIKQALLLRHYIDLVLSGELKSVPSDLYRNSKITFDILATITAIDHVVSQKTAIDTLTRAGYTITPKANVYPEL